MAAQRNSYHTGVIVLYRLGLLPRYVLDLIPYSTRYNWNHRDNSNIVGMDDPRIAPANIEIIRELIAEHHLFPVIKTLLYVNRFLSQEIQKIKGYRKILARSSGRIIHLVERFAPLLEAPFKSKNTRKRILRWIGVSIQQFRYWQRNGKGCPASLRNLCRVKHPQQLTTHETLTIQRYVQNQTFASWSLASIYFQILRDAAAFFALSTFYLYVRKLGLTRTFPSFKYRKEGIQASRPGEIIHADITEYRLADHRKVYIYHFADNFSRYPFRCMASFERKPEITLQNLEAIIEAHPLLFEERFTLLVDDGIENKGALSEFASRNRELVLLLIAGKDIRVSNSMIEARNKSLKNEYLQNRQFTSLEALQKFLDTEYLANYRNRPLEVLSGFTPAEVLNGDIPQKYRFSEDIATAKRNRIEENQAFNCTHCSTQAISV